MKNQPPIRDLEQIQRAHDMLWAIVLGKVPSPFGQASEPMLQTALEALCWVLQHDHGDTGFKKNLTVIARHFRACGVIERRIT